MSRIGNKPITVPAGVEVKVDGSKVTVKGPKGTLEREISPKMEISLDINQQHDYRNYRRFRKKIRSKWCWL